MRHAVSKELYAYWRALRRGGSPPERNEVEPGAIRCLLPDTFVLEFDAENGYPFRICGSRINALFLKELRGAGFLNIWRNADQTRINAILRTAADHEAPCLLLAETCPAGVAPVEIEVTLLPLRHRSATHARMLGSLSVCDACDWLGLIASGPATLKAWSGLEPGVIEQRHTPRPVRLARAGANAQLVRGV